MSLISHDNGWKSFDSGRIWRCQGARGWLLELDREGNTPSYFNLHSTVNKIRSIHNYYTGRISLGILDSNGTGLDLITANAMAESLGSILSQIKYDELVTRFQDDSTLLTGDCLNEVVEFIIQNDKFLVRKEPGYINPIQTPGRISLGAHHMLLSTALDVLGVVSALNKESQIADLVLKLPTDTIYSAELAVKYLNRAYSKHLNEPPLVAATYNAGSPRPDQSNAWNLRQYGNHIDRWTAFYNTSRLLRQSNARQFKDINPPVNLNAKNLEIKVLRTTITEKSTIGDLYIDEKYHCHTLEDVVRARNVKVYGETAIPSGRYEIIMNFSNKFQKIMPLILDVPQFEGVRIHKGNTAEDTLGCILVGENKCIDRIWNCSMVYNKLKDSINAAYPKSKIFISIE
jgi:hypothetical protein